MKTVKDLPSNPTICQLMEVAYNEGLEGHIMISTELDQLIDDTFSIADMTARGRIWDAHANGWADYRTEVEAF